LRISATRRVVWDFPQPVRTAHTATTGFSEATWVEVGPNSQKSAPAAPATAARSITCWWETSE